MPALASHKRGGKAGLKIAGEPGSAGDRRERILQTAEALLKDRNARSLTLTAIADELGLTRAAPLYYFANTNHLFAGIANRGFAELNRRLRSVRTRPNEERLRETASHFIEFAIENPGNFRVMFDPELFAGAGSRPGKQRTRFLNSVQSMLELRSRRAEAIDLIRRALDDAQRLGLVVEGNLQNLTMVSWATLHGLATMMFDKSLGGLYFDDQSAKARLTHLTVNTLLRGLSPGKDDADPMGNDQRDKFTGLFTARHFHVQLHKASEAARADDTVFALLVIHVDGLGILGPVGYKAIAKFIAESMGDSDFLYRYDSDEFCAILDRQDEEMAYSRAEEIRSAVASHAFLRRQEDLSSGFVASFGEQVRFTASIGVGSWQGPRDSADNLLIRVQHAQDCADRNSVEKSSRYF